MNSNKLWHFIKWNFSDVKPYTKRLWLYLAIGLILEAFVFKGGFFVSPLLMVIDLTVDVVKCKYNQYCDEQRELLDSLKENS